MGHWARVVRFAVDPVAAMTALRGFGDVVGVCRDNPAIVCAFGAALNQEVLSRTADFQHDETMFVGPPRVLEPGAPIGPPVPLRGNMRELVDLP